MPKDDESGRSGQSGGVRITGGVVNAQNIAGRDIHLGPQIPTSEAG